MYTHEFHQKKPRNILLIITAVTGLSMIGWLMNTYIPNLLAVVIFFLLLFSIVTSLALFALLNVRRSLLIAGAVTGFLFLRLIGLREPLYPILLTACLVSLELYLNKR